MTDTREYIINLAMPEKVSLFKELYNELAGQGIDGDTELAHVNTFEASLLKSLGGSGTINDITGLREYKGGGDPPPPPTTQTVTQTSEFPTELKPFIKDILGESKGEFGREKEEGFLGFPGPQLAAFTPEQEAAFAGGREQFTGLAGTPLGRASTYYTPALAATALGTAEVGPEDIQRRMDPFIQSVVDVAKREAGRDEERAAQARAAKAVAGQGFLGGTRIPLVVEEQARQDFSERLGDIQARGLSTAFQNAQRSAEAQRAREMTGGRQFAALGDITGARARGDIAGLAGIGETQQARNQQALDIARREFEEEKAFPQTALQRYASIIRGFPLTPSQTTLATRREAPPSLAQSLTAAGLGAAGVYGMFGGFNPKAAVGAAGGLISLLGGGGLFRKTGVAQPQSATTTRGSAPARGGDSSWMFGRGLPPEIMELLRRHAQENANIGASNEGGLLSLQGGGGLNVNMGTGGGYSPVASYNVPNPIPRGGFDKEALIEELERRGLSRSNGGLMSIVRREAGDIVKIPPLVPEGSSGDWPTSSVGSYEPFSYDQAKIDYVKSARDLATQLGISISESETLINEMLQQPKLSAEEEKKEIREHYTKEADLAKARALQAGERKGMGFSLAAFQAAPEFLVPGRTWGESAAAATEKAMPTIGETMEKAYEAEDLATLAATDRRAAERAETKLVEKTVWEDKLKRLQLKKAITADKLQVGELNKGVAEAIYNISVAERDHAAAFGLSNLDLGDYAQQISSIEVGEYGEILDSKIKEDAYKIVAQARSEIMSEAIRNWQQHEVPIINVEITNQQVLDRIQAIINKRYLAAKKPPTRNEILNELRDDLGGSKEGQAALDRAMNFDPSFEID